MKKTSTRAIQTVATCLLLLLLLPSASVGQMLPFDRGPAYTIVEASRSLGIPMNQSATNTQAAAPAGTCNCTVSQDGFSVPLSTFMGDVSAVEWFDYDTGNSNSNTGLELSDGMVIYLYEDPSGNISLIVHLDEGTDNTGGSETVTVDCLPFSASVDQVNDPGSDMAEFVDGQLVGTFAWGEIFNDGMVIGGLSCGLSFTIDATFDDGINSAFVLDGMPGAPNVIGLPGTGSILISCGDAICCPSDFELNGSVGNATCSSSSDGFVTAFAQNGTPPYAYEWQDGAGNTIAFDTPIPPNNNSTVSGLEPGTYCVTVTDSQGELYNGCTAEACFTVGFSFTPPIAFEPPVPFQFCSDGGLTTVNLTEFDSFINGGDPSLNVLWFQDQDLFLPIPFPQAYSTFLPTFVYAVVDDGTCQSDPVLVNLEPKSTPIPAEIDYIACEEENGTATFNLNANQDDISGGGELINFFWFEDEMMQDTIFDPENYVSGDGTVYVQLEEDDCFSQLAPIDLTVIDAPNGSPDTLFSCAAPNGDATYDLLSVADSIYMGDGDLGFYEDSLRMDSIDMPMTYIATGQDTVYAFVVEQECVSDPIPIFLIPIISEVGPADTLRLCDDGMGNAVFDLVSIEAGLQGSSDSLAWYTDAAGTIPVPDPAAYPSNGTDTVYYSLFVEECESALSEVMLFALPTPLVQPDTLTACDDGSGNGIFDLTAADIITNGVGSVNWYEDAALSTPISDTTAYVAGAGTVYAQAAQDTCLSAVVEVVLNITTVDVADSAALEECGAQDGTAVFDLTSVEGDIYSGPGTVSWALNPDQSGPIADPANYTSPTNTVFAFATEDSCTSLPVPVSLTVIVSTPGADDSIEQCDDGMGSSVFDLTAIEGGLIGGADSLIWYEDDMANMPIPDPSMVTSSGSTVYYTLFVQSCESPAAAVDLIPLPTPLVQTDTLETCDEGSGEGSYDLTDADIITNGIGTVAYFEDAGATQVIADPANYVSGAGTVYAQATEGSCSSAVVPIELELIAAVSATSDSLSLCGDGTGIATFDLTTAADDIRSGGGGIVNWFEDAAGSTPIADPENYTTGTTTVYANVTAGSCASDIVPVFLTVIPLPIANPASQQACADPVTGEGTFDLTALEPAVSGGAGSVSWFEDSTLTSPIADPANFVSLDTTVYTTVFDGSCTSLPGEVTLEVLPLPMTMPDTLRSCDNGSGTPVFDLTTANVTTTPGTTISWFENANGTGTIFDPANYPSTGGAVYAVVDGGNCTAPPVEVVLEAIFALSPEAVCAITANDSVGFSWLMVADSFSVTYNINGGPEIGPEIVLDTTFSVSMLDQGDVVNITVTALVDPLCTDGITSTATCLADVCQPVNFTYNLDGEYCSDEGSITLSATPAGGTFSGDGVTGNTLDLAGLSGSSFVFYDYYDAATDCDYRDSVTIEVFEPLPPTTISCDGITVNDITFNWEDVGATNYLVITEVEGVMDTIVTTALTTTVSGLSSETDVTITVTPQGPPPCGNGPATTETCTTLPCPPPPIAGEFVADEYCSDTSGVQLPGLYPGGVYSGPGVSGSIFDPSAAGAGEAIISFSFTDTANGCAYILEDTAQVIDPLTPPDISCAGATPNSVTFSWTGGNPGGYQYYYQVAGEAPTPIVTGPETELTVENITDLQDVTVYVSALGGAPCGNSPFDSLLCTSAPCPDVALSIDNLLPEYCTDEPAFALQGSPAGGTFSGPGITGDTLNPAAAGTGLIEIVYAYTDTTTDCSYVDTFSTSLFTPLETPVASCGDASPSSASFSWTNVGADDYAISWTIDGSPAGSDVVTDTSYLITGLLPEQVVEMTIIAQGPPPCGNAEPVVISCASTPCPPISFEFTAPDPTCSDDGQIQLETTVVGSSPTGSVSWSGDGILNTDGLFDASEGTVGENLITISYQDGVCSYDTIVTVVVGQEPVASFTSFSADGTFCSDSTLTLVFDGTATAEAIFDWQIDGGTIVQQNGNNELVVSWDSPGSYAPTLQINDAGCFSEVFELPVELIAPLQPADISCEQLSNTEILFSWPAVDGADDYDIAISNGTGSAQSATSYLVSGLLPEESVTITVTAVGPTPCGPVTSELTCSTPPCAPQSSSISGPTDLCQGEDAVFEISLTGGIEDEYQFNYLLNGQEDSIVLSSPGELSIAFGNVQDTLELELLSFFALSNPVCVYDAGQSWQVNVMTPPTAGTALPPVVLCASTDSVVNLGERLDGATTGGSWTITSGGNPPGFDAAAGTQSTFAMPAGTYIYTYTASGMGICPDAREQVEITINPTPEVDAGDSQELSCNMGMVSIGSSSNPTSAGFSYLWSSETAGVIIDDPTSAIIETGQPGTYTLQITDPNGCTNSDQVVVTASLDAPVASFTADDPSCFGDTDGTIFIDSISGGVGPFEITLNGENVGSQTSFTNLPEGSYDIVITGQNGCFTEQQFTLVEPEPITVVITTSLDAGGGEPQQVVVDFGDSLRLNANVVNLAPIDTFIWQPEGQGRSFSYAPLESELVSVTVVDVNGCSASDDLQIIVEKVRDVYVPNIFSPNDDGRNDIFYIQSGPQVERIESFRIFNRWGEAVFEAEGGFPPNDPDFGWDGTYRGERMNAAVFVWYAEVEFIDGETVLIKGDVTLLR